MTERIYTTVDKTSWGDGPWLNEPDKVQWKDDATGLDCLAKRQPSLGHWCGYVGVPEGHPAYAKAHEDVRVGGGEEEWPDVHGGLTYAAHCQEGDEAEAVCHVPEPGELDKVWWLGFDCAHFQDVSPAFKQRYGDMFEGSEYRDLEYVRREVKKLAAQLGSVSDPA